MIHWKGKLLTDIEKLIDNFFLHFSFDSDRLHLLVTERAYPLVTHQIELKTIRWGFHGSLEPPRVVHIRCTDVLSENNVFAQVTVRFHTQQVRRSDRIKKKMFFVIPELLTLTVNFSFII